jgi:cyanophycin synthetase
MGHVIEHIALEIQTLAGMDTGFVELVRLKHLGPTMLFQLYRRERWPFAAESAVAIAESLIAGTEYDFRKRFTKNEKSGNVSLRT